MRPNRFAPHFPFRSRAGLTLLEIVIVLLIISIIGVLLFQSFQGVTARAERTKCTANLRNLFVALDAYTRDQSHWPQCPYEIGHPQFDTWWIKEMSGYNLTRASWTCPTYQKLQQKGEAAKTDEKSIDYTPCQFDENPRTPYKWATQPWAAEVGDFHGDGNLILFPDGSIKGFNQFTARK